MTTHTTTTSEDARARRLLDSLEGSTLKLAQAWTAMRHAEAHEDPDVAEGLVDEADAAITAAEERCMAEGIYDSTIIAIEEVCYFMKMDAPSS